VIQAVFLDRDGTLVRDPGFLRDPAAVELLPGAAKAVARLNGWSIRVIVVTNQSGIARGLVTEPEYRAVARRVDQLLAEAGARLDATYHCPHYPPITGLCECRKPGDLLYRTAGAHFGLDLGRCAWIGDRLTDLIPSRRFGGRAVLVRTGEGSAAASEAERDGYPVVQDLAAAVAYLVPSGA